MAARALGTRIVCLQVPLAVFRARRLRGSQPCRRLQSSSFTPSGEQQTVADLCAQHNVLVSARPGSGKTATVQAIVAAYPEKHTCAILFSKQLQRETAQRLGAYTNAEVMTFHGMGGRLAGTVMPNDEKLLQHRARISDTGETFSWRHEPFDIVILDEFQDCNNILFWLVSHFVAANNEKLQLGGRPPARLVVLGDEPQCIFQFMGADQRYLTMAPKLLCALNPYAFSTVPLSRSFRLSKQTVNFINNVFLGGEQRIVSSKTGPKPLVIRCPITTKRGQAALASRLASMIKQYGPENAAIIAPSGRGKHMPLQKLVNTLAEDHGIPISVAFNGMAPLDDDKVTHGKLCVTTFHQFKGRERDLVIVLGADASYFTYFGKTLPHDKCPNPIYVALTRAAKQLVLVHNEKNGVMPFVQVDALYKTADVINMTDNDKPLEQPPAPRQQEDPDLKLALPKIVTVTDFLRHMPEDVLGTAVARELVIERLAEPLPNKEHLVLHSVVPTGPPNGGMHEATSDINGMVVAAAFEHQTAGTLRSLGRHHRSLILDMLPTYSSLYAARLSRGACRYEAFQSGYIPRLIQMKDHRFDWIRPQHLATAVSRTQAVVVADRAANLQFEKTFTAEISLDGQEAIIIGKADVVSLAAAAGAPSDSDIDSDDGDNDSGSGSAAPVDAIWEIKFVKALSTQHIAQVSLYALLASLAANTDKVPRVVLFNARDNETLQIAPRDGVAGLKRMLEALLRAKYTARAELDTDVLIKQCASITSEVLKTDIT